MDFVPMRSIQQTYSFSPELIGLAFTYMVFLCLFVSFGTVNSLLDIALEAGVHSLRCVRIDLGRWQAKYGR